jgi:hypothetical protein
VEFNESSLVISDFFAKSRQYVVLQIPATSSAQFVTDKLDEPDMDLTRLQFSMNPISKLIETHCVDHLAELSSGPDGDDIHCIKATRGSTPAAFGQGLMARTSDPLATIAPKQLERP